MRALEHSESQHFVHVADVVAISVPTSFQTKCWVARFASGFARLCETCPAGSEAPDAVRLRPTEEVLSDMAARS